MGHPAVCNARAGTTCQEAHAIYVSPVFLDAFSARHLLYVNLVTLATT